MGKEQHIGIVTRNVEKASGATSFEQTAKVSSQSLVGAVYFKAETLYDGEYPLPALPSFGYAGENNAGWFWVPKVGDTIIVELDESLDEPDPRYVACLYTNVITMHRDFKKNYPYRLGLVTNSNHRFIFDDYSGVEIINLEHTFGSRVKFYEDGSLELTAREVTNRDDKDEDNDTVNEDHLFKLGLDYTQKEMDLKYTYSSGKFAQLKFDGAGELIELTDHRGNKITLDDSGIEVVDKNTNKATFDSDGVKVEDKNANKVTMDSSGVEVEDKNSNKKTFDSSGIKLEDKNGNTFEMSATGVKIQDAAGNIFQFTPAGLVLNTTANLVTIDGSIYGVHQHLGNLGVPTGPPMDGNTA